MKVSGVAGDRHRDDRTAVIEDTRTAVGEHARTRRTIETTPILGRKFEDLLTLTPGVSIVQGPDGDEITFAGQRGIFNNISLDGGDYNNGFFGEQAGGQRAAIDITLEAVKEFQVIATGAPAEFGRTAGGVVNVITKSGTNQPHGSLFHFQRLEGLTGELSDGTHARGLPSRAVRRHDRRADPEGQGVLLRRGRRDHRQLRAPESQPPVGDCPARCQAPTVPRTRRSSTAMPTASGWRCSASSRRGSGRTRARRSSIRSRRRRCCGKLDASLNASNNLSALVELQSLAQGERDVRRRDLRHVGQRHRGRSGAHQRR